MDETVTKNLQARLEDERSRLRREIDELREATKATTYLEDETEAYDQHMADNASSLVGRQTDMTLLQNLERELGHIDTAMERISSGDYGTCEVCGKPIAELRLKARPSASTCIDCQSAIEDRQRRESSALAT